MVVGYNKNYGWKTAFASPENAPTYLHAHKLMRKVWGDMPEKGHIGGDKWNQVADHVNDNFFFIDMERYTLESVLRKGADSLLFKLNLLHTQTRGHWIDI